MANFSSLKFEVKDLIMIGTVMATLGGFGWKILTKIEHVEMMIAEVKVYKGADDKVVNTRLENLEITQANDTKRQNDFEKFQFKIEAILENDNRLKIVKDGNKNN